MEAKDTVMSDEQIYQASFGKCSIMEAQAEITAPVFFEEGRKAGIKEVVEWINKNATDIKCSGVMLTFLIKMWQAKLKEWEEE